MSKYALLGDYLRKETGSEITLTFDQIEQIIGTNLPPSAAKHDEWWQNSTPGTDSHVQALAWMTTGWRKLRVDRSARYVTFARAGSNPDAEALESLAPRRKEVIYDILKRANISVEGWHWKKDQIKVEDFRSNPQFCYNWSFGSIAEGYVLCLWHGTLQAESGVPYFAESVLDTANELRRIADDRTKSASARSRTFDQSVRALNLNAAIRESYDRRLPVRVIVCAGDQRARNELAEKASAVSRRILDSDAWYVHRHDPVSGECKIVRGVKPDLDATEVSHDTKDADETDDVVQQRAIKTRRGQGPFRDGLLAAYRRRCAVTGSVVGAVLEAAHIVPHAEKTDYETRNGILLRADIHTLFDEHLLTIDTRYRVKLSKLLRHSEYRDLDGKFLRVLPERSEDQPSVNALEQRVLAFNAKEAKR
ncbi:HNH endonuclease [Burkholderia gladioli]|uniref:HNH endonuclease n=1 Tax=Burkholderia gladioli TaxID=28095 RepID=UPI00164075C3|nr:HNH endonuclease signature motif containing protein [Burkholderia gladioli]MBU9322035.1 HNH endonuclease [Burkholderia gladioli]